MRAIDLRLWPPFKSFLEADLFFKDLEKAERAIKQRNLKQVPESLKQTSMELLIQEMDEAGITYGAVPMRITDHGNNDDLFEVERLYPNRFLGLPQIDPLEPESALKAIEKYVVKGCCKGIYIEHAFIFNKEYWYVNDERAYPVYKRC